MTYEEVIERVRAVPQERLKELDEYVIYLVHSGRKSCRGIAHEYANPALIAGEKDVSAKAFSGGEHDAS